MSPVRPLSITDCSNPGSGLGRGCALAYAAEGAAGVVFADKNKAAAEQTSTESKRIATNPAYQALTIQVDITDEKEVDAMVEETLKKFGRIDYAFNSAGVILHSFEHFLSPVISASLQLGRLTIEQVEPRSNCRCS